MLDGGKVLAIITARGGSKGVPGKNIIEVGGRPLIQWTIDAARDSQLIDRLVLSSDDPAIIDVAKNLGCDVPFVRTADLATDTASSADVVADVLERVPGYDYFVLLQPTSPLRLASDIDAALAQLGASSAPSCVSITQADDHPFWLFQRNQDGRLDRFFDPGPEVPTRRQDLPVAWRLNGAIYAVRSDWFLQTRAFFALGSLGYEMPASRSLDIDTYDDLAQFRTLVERADC